MATDVPLALRRFGGTPNPYLEIMRARSPKSPQQQTRDSAFGGGGDDSAGAALVCLTFSRSIAWLHLWSSQTPN
jgi:membrane-associated PAP2 superfamily phosphatase